ncbi:unnamed protein product, partial [Didymodactylos carnosus]
MALAAAVSQTTSCLPKVQVGNKDESIDDSFRIFFYWLQNKICEHALVDGFSYPTEYWKARVEYILSLTKETTLDVTTIKSIISSLEYLYNEKDYTFLNKEQCLYAVIHYNKEFDILSNNKLDDSQLGEEQILLISKIKTIHVYIMKSGRKLSQALVDKTFNPIDDDGEILKKYLNMKSADYNYKNVIEFLYHQQQTDNKFKYLKQLPELSLAYYCLPYVDLISGKFDLKLNQQQQSGLTTSSSTTIITTPTNKITNNTSPVPQRQPRTPRQSSPHHRKRSLTPTPVTSRISTSLQMLPPNPNRQTNISNNNNNNKNNHDGTVTIDEDNDQHTQHVCGMSDNDIIDKSNNTDDEEQDLEQRLHQFRNDCVFIPQITTTTSNNIALPQRQSLNNITNNIIIKSDQTTMTESLISTDQFIDLPRNIKEPSSKEEYVLFRMSTINDNNNAKQYNNKIYVDSCQQTHKSFVGSTTIKEDLPPHIIYKNELNRLKRYENHLEILNVHLEQQTFPSSLGAMPRPTIGADCKDFVKEWNEIENDRRRRLLNKTIQHVGGIINDCNTKIQSVFDSVDNNKRLEIEVLVDEKLKPVLKKSWCKLMRQIKPKIKITKNNFGFINNNNNNNATTRFPTQQSRLPSRKQQQQKHNNKTNINNNNVSTKKQQIQQNKQTQLEVQKQQSKKSVSFQPDTSAAVQQQQTKRTNVSDNINNNNNINYNQRQNQPYRRFQRFS